MFSSRRTLIPAFWSVGARGGGCRNGFRTRSGVSTWEVPVLGVPLGLLWGVHGGEPRPLAPWARPTERAEQGGAGAS